MNQVEWIEKGLDLLYPPKCPICEEALAFGKEQDFCDSCAAKLEYAGIIYDSRMDSGEEGFGHSFEAAYAVFKYHSVAGAIYHLKYQEKVAYGKLLGRAMWKDAAETLKAWEIDCVLPVPLHANRKKKRGFNQSQVLAAEVGRGLGKPMFPEMVLRCIDTKPMKDLNALQRQNNLKKAFKLGQNDVKLKTILIVDDIYTTGTTTDEISSLLLEAGAKKVYVLTLSSDAEETAR